MRFAEELAARLGLDEEIVSGKKYVVFLGRCAYFEGVRGLRAFSSSAVEVDFGGVAVRAEGENLSVRQFCGGDLAVFGCVVRVEETR